MTRLVEDAPCQHVWYVEHDDGKHCRRAPLVCAECIRAIAVEQWDGIARHETPDPRCVLCGVGARDYCPSCAVAAAVAHRAAVRG